MNRRRKSDIGNKNDTTQIMHNHRSAMDYNEKLDAMKKRLQLISMKDSQSYKMKTHSKNTSLQTTYRNQVGRKNQSQQIPVKKTNNYVRK